MSGNRFGHGGSPKDTDFLDQSDILPAEGVESIEDISDDGIGESLDGVAPEQASAAPVKLPLIALVGRPNVGKSTIFNRLLGQRAALVYDQPGVTRDRLFGISEGWGKRVRIVDTGGLEEDSDDPLWERMAEQTQTAIDEADLVMFVLDAANGVHPNDADVLQRLRRSGKRFVLVLNKMDTPDHEDARRADFYALGVADEDMFSVSAEHGRGFDTLTEYCFEVVNAPDADEDTYQHPVLVRAEGPKDGSVIEWNGGPIKIAVIGKPNVGKSTLVNTLLGEEKLLASDIAGTTRDSTDSTIFHEGQEFNFIDTAGMRRKRSIADKLERFSVMQAMRSIDRADVVLMVFDSSVRPSDQDVKIASVAHDKGKAVILVANKWDLIENPDWKERYVEALRVDLQFANYAPIQRVSAKTGKSVQRIFARIVEVQEERHRRVATSALNRFFREVLDRTPPPVYKGKRGKVFYVTQPLVRPPTFILSSSNCNNIPNAYKRFVSKQLRERFGFVGTPIWVKFRDRSKKSIKQDRDS